MIDDTSKKQNELLRTDVLTLFGYVVTGFLKMKLSMTRGTVGGSQQQDYCQ